MDRQTSAFHAWMRTVATFAMVAIASFVGAGMTAGDDAIPSGADPSERTLATRFKEIEAKWVASDLAYYMPSQEPKTGAEKNVVREMNPAAVSFALEMVEHAESSPGDSAVSGAMLLVLRRLLAPFEGPPADVERRAIDILVAHHSDDPEVARVIVRPNGMFSPGRERLLRGLVKNATQAETEGLARLALAMYLTNEADAFAQLQAGFTQAPAASSRGAAFREYARAGDVLAIRREAEALLDEVKARYGDIPFVRAGGEVHTRRKTLGEAADSVLDELQRMAIGKPAPEIDAADLTGNPLKLSDYHGKVVVIVFWASWCGQCVDEVPRERALLERFEGRPFALLGVNMDTDLETARKAADEHGVNWPGWNDPDTTAGEGPITDRYHIHSIPFTVVVDQAGIIRAKNARGDRLEMIINDLLAKR